MTPHQLTDIKQRLAEITEHGQLMDLVLLIEYCNTKPEWVMDLDYLARRTIACAPGIAPAEAAEILDVPVDKVYNMRANRRKRA